MRRILALLIASLFLLSPVAVYADGIIICEGGQCPPPPCQPVRCVPPPCLEGQPCPLMPCPPNPCPSPIFPLTIQYHRVTVTIDNQVATTHVDQMFRNDTAGTVEGTYIFPLPTDATVSQFAMWVDGQKIEGKVLSAQEARQIYNDIVRQARDPALLEYVGRGAVKASIFPIPAGATRRIELEYAQVLLADQGLIHYRYPLNTEKFSARPLEQVSVSVNVVSAQPVHAIYSPSHSVAITRDGDYRFTAGYEANNVTPNTDFDLYYSVSTENIGLNLLTYRNAADGDGFFILLAAPNLNVDAARVVAKDVIVVLDQSGSMEGEKFRQAQDALKYVLNHLNTEDRFNIIPFSTATRRYAETLQPASAAREAVAWVDTLAASGSTDINRALLEAMGLADKERPTIIIFLTDGLPTVGEVNTEKIISNVKQSAPQNVRLFAFGVGYDVDTVLLDTLTEQNHGASSYVRPGARIDEAVSAFYARVSTPVLSNLQLDFGLVTVSDVYPEPLPDLFAGGQLVAVGRYQNPGPATVALKGMVNGQPQTFTYADQTFKSSGGSEFIPRLWSTRKIGYLLNQIRLHGENKEVIDEIVKLSVRYGIVTPYTSYLVTENAARVLTEDGRNSVADEQYAAAAAATPAPSSGGAAVDKAEAQSAIAGADTASAPQGAAANVVQVVGNRTFLFSNDVWIDTAFDPSKMKATPVEFAGNDYFTLLESRPELAGPFALGARVIALTNDGLAYEVVATAAQPIAVPPTYTPAPATSPAPAITAAPGATAIAQATKPAAPTVGVTPPDGPLPIQLSPTATPGGNGPCASGFLPALGLIAVPFLLRRRK